eukprot:332866_1
MSRFCLKPLNFLTKTKSITKAQRLLSSKRTHTSYAYDLKQGQRMSMEDYIIHNNNFNDTHLLFCVFDGHYGHKCAEFLSNNIQQYLIKNWQMYPNMQQIFENTMEQIDKDISKTKTDNYKLYS